jgi:hypothetical protein
MMTCRRRMLALAAALLAAAAAAQEDAAGRERIRAERHDIEQRHQAAVRECREQFAVTACTEKAQSERRARLEDLRQAEAALDDKVRRERAAARLEAIERKRVERQQRSPAPAPAASAAQRPPLVPRGAASAAAREPRPPLDGGAQAAAARASAAQARRDKQLERQRRIAERLMQRASDPKAAAPLPADAPGSAPRR